MVRDVNTRPQVPARVTAAELVSFWTFSRQTHHGGPKGYGLRNPPLITSQPTVYSIFRSLLCLSGRQSAEAYIQTFSKSRLCSGPWEVQ